MHRPSTVGACASDAIDLYFRPLFVFQFEKLDPGGNMMERKLEELDGLTRNRWTNLATTEYRCRPFHGANTLRLSADIGLVLLNDVPVLGQALQITSIVAHRFPVSLTMREGKLPDRSCWPQYRLIDASSLAQFLNPGAVVQRALRPRARDSSVPVHWPSQRRELHVKGKFVRPRGGGAGEHAASVL